MFQPIKEDDMKSVLDKLEEIYFKCQGIEGLCRLHGTSIINGKVRCRFQFLMGYKIFCMLTILLTSVSVMHCNEIVEGSVGDKMAQLKGGKLSLLDVLRHGITVAMTISELHSRGILVLNLKPCNVLLDETEQAILGDFVIPYLLLGISLENSEMARRIGTPNYMAPEQWQPQVRGPISFETDSWSFGHTIVEMLTGVRFIFLFMYIAS